MEPPDQDGDLEPVPGGQSAVPEGICGFELRPEDVGLDQDVEWFREYFGTACCWHETWRNGRCVWHAEVNQQRFMYRADPR